MRNRFDFARLAGLCLLGILCLPAPHARADFALVEDFESLTPGDIDDQNSWTASGLGSSVVTLPGDPTNQVLQVTVNTGILYKPMTVPNGQTRMLFLRFRYQGQHNYSLGMSHLSSPDEFSDFGPEIRKSGAQDELKIHDGNTYQDLTTLSESTWYNLWILIDNDAGSSQVWLHDRPGQGALASDRLDAEGVTSFDFRTDTHSDLIRFYLKAADGGSGIDPLWIDDIYLETTDAANLSNPIPEPATFALVLLGWPFLRRRQS